MFSSRNFIILPFAFKSVVYMQFTFVHAARYGVNVHFFPMWLSSHFSTIRCEDFLSPIGLLRCLCSDCVKYESILCHWYIYLSLCHAVLIAFFWIFEFYLFFYTAVLISHQFYTLQCIHVNPNHPIHHTTTPTPLPLSTLGVHTFVLYICVSISALQTPSSVPFF